MKDTGLEQTALRAFENSKQSDFSICGAGIRDFQPDCTFDPKMRDCYVMEYCIKGCGKLTLEGQVFRIETGDCFVIPPGTAMRLAAVNDEPCRLIWVDIVGIRMPYILQQMGFSESFPIFPWRNNQLILDCFRRLCAINDRKDKTVELDRLACLYHIFAECFREASRFNFLPVSRQNDYIGAAIRYMEINYYKKPKISDIAEHLGITRSYLYTLFENQLHESPQEYLNHLRMKKACDFLMNPHSTVESIALSLNCRPQNLTRLFKQIIGMTPSEYRRQLNGK